MSYTQQDLDKVNKAIASGARRVRIADNETEFRTLSDLKVIRSEIIKELNAKSTGAVNVSRQTKIATRSGW